MVSERRPHWDDELIETVKNAIFRNRFDHVEGPLYDQDVFPVIAAVEDWAEWEHVPKGTLARIERIKDYCERRREDRGGDLTALDVLRLLHGSPVVGDLSSQADDGQRLDVNALLSARMEQVERAKRAEAEVERLNRIISESKPWIAMADELADAQATIQRVREIHQPHRCRMSTRHIDCSIMFGGECSHEGKCQVCREKYPCATICALGGDGEPPQGPLQFYKGRSEGFTAIQTVGDAPGCPACDGVAGTECRCHLRTGCDLGTTRCHRAEAAEAVIERVRELCEQTTVSVSIGCRCYTDECSGTCGAGRPLSWHLNPAAVLAALDGDSDE